MIDFDRDLGIGTEPLPELRLSVFTGPNSRLRLAYTHGRWDGDTVIGQAIEFNGTTYPAGARVVSDLDLHYARLGWIWQPSLIPGVFRLGPIVEAKAFVAEMTLKAPNLVPRLQETERVTLVIPTVGLAADFRLFPLVDLFAEASGLTIGHPGHVVDAEAGARLSVLPFIGVTGGYRFFEVSGGENRSSARLRLSGPFLGVSSNTADSDADGTGNGGGVFVFGGTLDFKNTLIAGNADNSPVTKHPDCYGGLASQGYNLVGIRDPAGCDFVLHNDQVGTLASPIALRYACSARAISVGSRCDSTSPISRKAHA